RETRGARLGAGAPVQAGRRKALERELEWVRAGTRGRHAKGRARLARYEQLAAQAARPPGGEADEIHIPPGPRLGASVIEAKALTKGYGERLLIDDLSFTVPPGGTVGIVGANGAGKPPLFRLLLGLEQPDAGTVTLGPTVQLAYVDQDRAGLDPKQTVWEVVSGGLDHLNVGERTLPSRAWVASFAFRGSDQQQPVGVLSGGERNRLNLALTLKQ